MMGVEQLPFFRAWLGVGDDALLRDYCLTLLRITDIADAAGNPGKTGDGVIPMGDLGPDFSRLVSTAEELRVRWASTAHRNPVAARAA